MISLKKHLNKYVHLFSVFMVVFLVIAPGINAASADDKLDQECPISMVVEVSPTEVSSWDNPVAVTVTTTRYAGAGYYCGTGDTINSTLAVSINGKVFNIRSGDVIIDSDPVGDGNSINKRVDTNQFVFSNSANGGATNSTKSIGLAASGVVHRRGGYGEKVYDIVSKGVGVKYNKTTTVPQNPTTPGGGAATCKYTDTALSKDALLKAIKDKKPTTAQLNATLKKSGADFEVTAEVEKELTTAKVPASLIKLAKENQRSTCTAAGGTKTGNPNENINTNVGVSFNVNLDQKIGDFENLLNVESVPELLASLLRILFALIGTVAVIIIIVSGFRMVLSSGNEEAVTSAKKGITWAVIGLVISLMAFSIVAIVQRLIQG